MTDGKKAQLIRNLVMVGAFAIAIVLGYFVKLPVWDSVVEEKEAVEAEIEKAFREAVSADNQLTVVNSMLDGNPDSEKLKEILEQLKATKYSDQVELVELELSKSEELAEELEVDLEDFAGQLDFYASGQKLGTLRNETDPVVVEQTIDRYLEGLIKRFGPNWFPSVDGMMKAGRPLPAPTVSSPTPKSNGVPGMERNVGGVPGMTRAKPNKVNTLGDPPIAPKP